MKTKKLVINKVYNSGEEYPNGEILKTEMGELGVIRNGTFELIGQKVAERLISSTFELADELPSVENARENVIYLVPAADTNDGNYKDEYIFINGEFEKIGSTKVELEQIPSDDKTYVGSNGAWTDSQNIVKEVELPLEIPYENFDTAAYTESLIDGDSDYRLYVPYNDNFVDNSIPSLSGNFISFSQSYSSENTDGLAVLENMLKVLKSSYATRVLIKLHYADGTDSGFSNKKDAFVGGMVYFGLDEYYNFSKDPFLTLLFSGNLQQQEDQITGVLQFWIEQTLNKQIVGIEFAAARLPDTIPNEDYETVTLTLDQSYNSFSSNDGDIPEFAVNLRSFFKRNFDKTVVCKIAGKYGLIVLREGSMMGIPNFEAMAYFNADASFATGDYLRQDIFPLMNIYFSFMSYEYNGMEHIEISGFTPDENFIYPIDIEFSVLAKEGTGIVSPDQTETINRDMSFVQKYNYQEAKKIEEFEDGKVLVLTSDNKYRTFDFSKVKNTLLIQQITSLTEEQASLNEKVYNSINEIRRINSFLVNMGQGETILKVVNTNSVILSGGSATQKDIIVMQSPFPYSIGSIKVTLQGTATYQGVNQDFTTDVIDLNTESSAALNFSWQVDDTVVEGGVTIPISAFNNWMGLFYVRLNAQLTSPVSPDTLTITKVTFEAKGL